MKEKIENLKQKNEERKAFLKMIIAFIESFVLAKGEITKRGTTGYGCITVRYELSNFGGFSFVWENGDISGDTIEIMDEKGHMVLRFHYIDDKYEVINFDLNRVWQPLLTKVIERKDEILAEIAAVTEKDQQARREKAEQQKMIDSLTEEAKKLRIV